MHLVGIFAMLIPFLLLGLLSRLGEVSANITGALVLLCFPIVFGIGRFAVSTFVCFPLSVCAISAEKRADAFEGFSRSNAYFFQRPVVAFACVLCLFLAGLVGEQIVYWTITLGWWLARSTFLDSGGLVQPAAGKFVNLGDALAAALIAAYWASYFWSASAAIYLILRKAIDNTELDELDSIQSPQERALPQLASAPSASSAVAGMSSTHTTTDSEPAAGEAKERSLDDED
jgi:hypothetical protein